MKFRSFLLPGLVTLSYPALADSLTNLTDREPADNFLSDQMSDFMDRNKFEVRVRGVRFDDKYGKTYNADGTMKKNPEAGATGLGVQMNFQSDWYADM